MMDQVYIDETVFTKALLVVVSVDRVKQLDMATSYVRLALTKIENPFMCGHIKRVLDRKQIEQTNKPKLRLINGQWKPYYVC